MGLPLTGKLAFSDIDNLVGNTSNQQLSMSWVRANAKRTPGGDTMNVDAPDDDIQSLRGFEYYANTGYGNCNTGMNPANCGGNCGVFNCNDCVNCTPVDCNNCDAQSYLQPNCNCNCTFNCTSNGTYSYDCNCNCDCSWICACACW